MYPSIKKNIEKSAIVCKWNTDRIEVQFLNNRPIRAEISDFNFRQLGLL